MELVWIYGQLTNNFHNTFKYENTKEWMHRNFYWTFIIVILYIIGIKAGLKFMENRKPFVLRKFLTFWNIALALFSFSGACSTLPELYHVLTSHGIHHSICNNSFIRYGHVFWQLAFTLSKIPELADTAFVIARKQKLTFIHCFHHAWTLVVCWFVYTDAPSMARWTYNMNFSVHAIMYSYYAFKAGGVRVPKNISLFVTTIQILQMIVGLVGSLYVGIVLLNNGRCDVSLSSLATCLTTYTTLFLLFLNFFVRTYVCSPKRISKKTK